MSRAAVCALAVVAACGGPKLKEHVAELGKALPATLEIDRPREGDPRTVKIRIYADAAVRAQPKWKEEITEQVDYASQLLTPFVGVRMTVDKVTEWTREGDPHEALRQLTALDKGDDATWVIGYIAAGDVATKVMSELGDAQPLGHLLVIRGWAEKRETEALAATLPDLKDAQRAEVIAAHKRHKQTVILLHMLATTLGAIPETDPSWIQNQTYSPKQSGFSERNRELIQLAIDARVTDGSDEVIAKKLLEAIEKSEWGGWVGPERDLVVNRLRNVIDANKAGKTATDIPPAAYDQITRIKELARQGKLDDAMAELDNVIAAYPGNGSLTQLKCEILIQPRQVEKPPGKPVRVYGITDPKARAACARVSELAPGDPGPHIAVGEQLLLAGDPKGARAELAQAEGKIANLPAGAGVAWRKLITLYRDMGALTWTEEAIAKAKLDQDPIAISVTQTRNRYGVPRGTRLVAPEQEAALVAAVKAAQKLTYEKNYGDAEKSLAVAEKSWPRAPGLAAARCELAYYLGRFEVAKAACARSLATYPDESWALYFSGILELRDASGTKAGIEHLKKAIAVDPDLGQAWRTLAKAYGRTKDKAALDQLGAAYQAKFGQSLPR